MTKPQGAILVLLLCVVGAAAALLGRVPDPATPARSVPTPPPEEVAGPRLGGPRCPPASSAQEEAEDSADDLEEEVVEEWESLDDDDPDAVRWSKTALVEVSAADDGAPVAGAAVRVLVSWRPEEFRAGTTDPSGRVELDACNRGAVLWVRAVGFLAHAAKIEDWDPPLRVSLTRGRPLRGRVVRASDGTPVAGAEVYAWDETTGDEVDYRPEEYGALREGGMATDAEGRFEVAALPDGHPVTIATRAPGLGVATSRVGARASTEDVVLRLGGGGVLEGAVTRDDGEPASGVHVYAAPAGDGFGLGHPDSVWFAGGTMRFLPISMTDPAGHYRIEGLEVPGRYVPVAEGDDWSKGAGEPAALQLSSAHARRDISLVTAAWPNVRGHASDGSPITPSDCYLLNLDGSPVQDPFFSAGASYTVGSGEYSMHTRPPGRWLLVAQTNRPLRPVCIPIELLPGERKTIDVTFEEGLALEGNVVDPDGKPIPSARVTATTSSLKRSANAGGHGAFTLEGLPDGMLDLEVQDEDGFHGSVHVKVTCPASEPLRVVLPRRPIVVGRVVPPPEREWHVRALVGNAETKRDCRLSFAPDGSFRVPDVPAGEPFDLILRHHEGGCPAVWKDLMARVGAPTDLGDIEFPEGQTLTGVVLGADGDPLVHAHVVADESVKRREAHTDADGRFQLAGVPAHPFHVEVRAEGHVTLRSVVEPIEPVTLHCTTGVVMSGALVHPEAEGTGGRRLWFVAPDAGPSAAHPLGEATTDTVGRFEVHLVPGNYDVWTVRVGPPPCRYGRTVPSTRVVEFLGRVHVEGEDQQHVELHLP